ncbi:hypothetical protein NPIL_527631 [Nephila pilipes]|uniref:Uncharacterized protein n=1 Tax=Nephila pilipes TaxID=299642 RepID=A0A8X6NW20_NEPPI|nr:hypothetical protein NPIL_527631 [Nephila pilipes]
MSGSCPLHSDSPAKNYREMIKKFKIRECFVLLCPLNCLGKTKNAKKEMNTRDCYVLIKKLRKELVRFKKPQKSFVIHYGEELLRATAFIAYESCFLNGNCLDFDDLYKTVVRSSFADLSMESFKKKMFHYFREFQAEYKKNKGFNVEYKINSLKGFPFGAISISSITMLQYGSKHSVETTRNFPESETRQNGPGSIDLQENGLLENIAEQSTPERKEAQLLPLTSEPIPPEQTVQKRIEADQLLPEIKEKEPAIESPKQLLQEGISTNKLLPEKKEEEPAMKKRKLQEQIDLNHSLPEKKENEPAMKKKNLLDRIAIDQHLPARTNEHPLMETEYSREMKRKHSNELTETMHKQEITRKEAATDPADDESQLLGKYGKFRKWERMMQQKSEKVPNNPESIPNHSDHHGPQIPYKKQYLAAESVVPCHKLDSDRAEFGDYYEYGQSSDSDPSEESRREHDHGSDEPGDRVEKLVDEGKMDVRNGAHLIAFDEMCNTNGEWNDSVLKNPAADQIERISVIKTTDTVNVVMPWAAVV